MVEKFERKCVELFGEYPLNIDDIMFAKALNYTEEDLMYEAAKKYCAKEQYNFYKALCEWKNGNKLQITHEEAEKRNNRFKNARAIVEVRGSFLVNTPLNWTYFQKDDPTICLYIGLPLNDELCEWAKNYKKPNT